MPALYAAENTAQQLAAINKHFPNARASELAKLDKPLIKKLANGEIPTLLVLLNYHPNTAAINTQQSQSKKALLKQRSDSHKQYIQQQNRQLGHYLKANNAAVTISKHFDYVPISIANTNSWQGVRTLLNSPNVIGLSSDVEHKYAIAQSNPIINQPLSVSNGIDGNGTTVAVFDSGVDYTHSDFGSCTAPGIPAGCRVLYTQDFAADDGQLDDTGHGTVVAGIVAGVASSANLVVLDVFNSSGSASSTNIISAINWVVANVNTYGIVAANFSLSDGTQHNSSCDSSGPPGPPSTNPFTAAFNSLISVDILPVAASGNDGHTNGISSPACVTPAFSVGATYDFSFNGTITWGQTPNTCTDTNSQLDDITCFSNSGANLDLLAPGALTDVAGLTGFGGTSMAAPHVAAAAAMIKQQFPLASYLDVEQRLKTSGTVLTDTRNGLSFPRLDLQYSLDLIDSDNDGTLDLYDPAVLDPCLPSPFNSNCTQDSDGDGNTDFTEGAITDTDADGIKNYLESSITDTDSDGVVNELDAFNNDPCLPSAFNMHCPQDSDSDGSSDYIETELADTDGDGIANYLESLIIDTDSDGVADQLDIANSDACIPTAFNSQCMQDSDADGSSDYDEGETIDTDKDGILDYLESSITDDDNDGTVNELDPVNDDPCVPNIEAEACPVPKVNVPLPGWMLLCSFALFFTAIRLSRHKRSRSSH